MHQETDLCHMHVALSSNILTANFGRRCEEPAKKSADALLRKTADLSGSACCIHLPVSHTVSERLVVDTRPLPPATPRWKCYDKIDSIIADADNKLFPNAGCRV
jgi:hypothetical protein